MVTGPKKNRRATDGASKHFKEHYHIAKENWKDKYFLVCCEKKNIPIQLVAGKKGKTA
jgi:hypothetical protein